MDPSAHCLSAMFHTPMSVKFWSIPLWDAEVCCTKTKEVGGHRSGNITHIMQYVKYFIKFIFKQLVAHAVEKPCHHLIG